MARPELGTKRVCPTTGRKFYDLNRDPIVSPYTGEILARAAFEPAPPAPHAPADNEDAPEDHDLAASGPEVVSLEDAAAEQEGGGSDDTDLGDDEGGTPEDDTFLEEEEEGGDVADLIDGEIEDEEES